MLPTPPSHRINPVAGLQHGGLAVPVEVEVISSGKGPCDRADVR